MMKKFGIFAVISALLALAPVSVLALGQMSEPINITNALRGAQINQEIIAVNTDAKPITVVLTAAGDIKDWVKFYKPGDLKNSVATTTIPAQANLNMVAVISVPANAPNGEYKGALSVTSVPDKAAQTDQSSAAMSQKIDRQVTIKVSDTETVVLEASVIPKSFDIKPGDPLSVRIIYDNRGNISLTPSINFKIKTNDDAAKTVYNVIYPFPDNESAINPQAIQEISALEIPTTNLANGKYLTQLSFMRSDKVILDKQFAFSIGTQSSALTGNLGSSKMIWLYVLLAVILLVIAGWFLKNRMNSKQNL